MAPADSSPEEGLRSGKATDSGSRMLADRGSSGGGLGPGAGVVCGAPRIVDEREHAERDPRVARGAFGKSFQSLTCRSRHSKRFAELTSKLVAKGIAERWLFEPNKASFAARSVREQQGRECCECGANVHAFPQYYSPRWSARVSTAAAPLSRRPSASHSSVQSMSTVRSAAV